LQPNTRAGDILFFDASGRYHEADDGGGPLLASGRSVATLFIGSVSL
jgi:hypothetical protein